MSRFTLFFANDWRRKLMALFFAVALWFWVNQNVSDTQTRQFVVTTTEQTISSGQHTLQITVPDGWMLVQPAVGESIGLTFEGPLASLQQFFAIPCRASYRTAFQVADDIDNHPIPFSLDNLNWAREAEAKTYLSNLNEVLQPLQALHFERRKEVDVSLSPLFLQTKGQPAKGYHSQVLQSTFTTDQVNLSGPAREVKELQAAIQRAEAGEPFDYALLRTAKVLPSQRDDLRLELSLSQQALDAGLQMRPDFIGVTIPISLIKLPEVTWIPNADDLSYTGHALPAHLTLNTMSSSSWVATLSNSAMPSSHFAEQWVRKHIMLFVHLDRIPDDAPDGYEVPIEWALVDITSEEQKQELIAGLSVQPELESAGYMSVKKIEK